MSGPTPVGTGGTVDGAAPILEVTDLTKVYTLGGFPRRSRLTAVDGISFTIGQGRSVALVGESGSGKTTAARCLLRLVEPTSGTIRFQGEDITRLRPARMRRLYRSMQMVFQDPNSSLNPRMNVGETLAEPLRLHLDMAGAEQQDRIGELLELVGLSRTHLSRFPHQLSGGQRQRVGIARAIATSPSLVVLDEPTSSLDVSVRGHVLKLLLDLQNRLGLSYLFITHDLAVVRHVCQYVCVMYLGKIVEEGPTEQVFSDPRHPYTRALLSAVPNPTYGRKRERLKLVGEIPSPVDLPPGCRLVGRCPWAEPMCAEAHPPLVELAPGHRVACYVAERGQGTSAPVIARPGTKEP